MSSQTREKRLTASLGTTSKMPKYEYQKSQTGSYVVKERSDNKDNSRLKIKLPTLVNLKLG